MCLSCSGIGKKIQLDLNKLLDKDKSLNQGAIQFSPFNVGNWQWNMYGWSGLFDNDKPLKEYTEKEWYDLLYASGFKVKVENAVTRPSTLVAYDGLVNRFNRLWINRDISQLKKSLQAEIHTLVYEATCPVCNGGRLNEKALASKIDGYSIGDYFNMEISELIPIMKQIQEPVGRALASSAIEGLQRIV